MSSKPYAEVIGDPIAHSKSPAIHNFWLAKLGIDAEYRASQVHSDELKAYLDRRNGDDQWRGCNVTMPHKVSIMPLLDRVDSEAGQIGAVNTITMEDYYLIGQNTDAPGFLEPLKELIAAREYRFAYVVGAGGAARAVCHGLKAEGFRIWSFSRHPERTSAEFARYFDDEFACGMDYLKFEDSLAPRIAADPDRIDVFINASALGMAGYPDLAVKLDRFPEDLVVYDIVTSPLDTALLRRARQLGLRTIDGLAMLFGQAAVAFEKFFGVPAPREHDAELRTILTS